MRKFIVASLTAGAVLAGCAGSSHAGFFLRVPFVTVSIDRGVFVGAGPVQVQVPGRPVAVPPGPSGVVVPEPARAVPAEQLPPPSTLPGPAVASAKAMTVEQFVESFKPQPGRYEVLLVHPKSGCPVKVCFELPAGCPSKVRWTKHVLEFDYGRAADVRIRFYHNGDVKVFN
jgi:hypothetical protein